MRSCSVLALAVGLLAVGSCGVKAQTVDVQQKVETRLELKRLAQGHLIRLVNGQSMKVLAGPVVEESLEHLQIVGESLFHLYYRLYLQGGEQGSGADRRQSIEDRRRSEHIPSGQKEKRGARQFSPWPSC
jgi:hypothetical protein